MPPHAVDTREGGCRTQHLAALDRATNSVACGLSTVLPSGPATHLSTPIARLTPDSTTATYPPMTVQPSAFNPDPVGGNYASVLAAGESLPSLRALHAGDQPRGVAEGPAQRRAGCTGPVALQWHGRSTRQTRCRTGQMAGPARGPAKARSWSAPTDFGSGGVITNSPRLMKHPGSH